VSHYHQQDADPPGYIDIVDSLGHFPEPPPWIVPPNRANPADAMGLVNGNISYNIPVPDIMQTAAP
jgi:hypothetical protein